MDAEEALRGPGRLEPLHLALSPAHSLMGILNPVGSLDAPAQPYPRGRAAVRPGDVRNRAVGGAGGSAADARPAAVCWGRSLARPADRLRRAAHVRPGRDRG